MLAVEQTGQKSRSGDMRKPGTVVPGGQEWSPPSPLQRTAPDSQQTFNMPQHNLDRCVVLGAESGSG